MKTALCDLLHIEVPIVQASLGPWSTPELTAAVSNADAIGSLGAVLRAPDQVRAEIRRVRELTDKPFIVNFSMRPFNPEAFNVAMEEAVPAVSLAHAPPGDLPARAHDAGAVFIHMVNTPEDARAAADMGADAIIAQGSESGGFTGDISTLCLVPQVVDAVAPLPVLAAGGIADGRGFAAALILGAVGANIGTRFVASRESGVSEDWKRRVVEARSDDTVQITFADAVVPPVPGTYPARPRMLRTPFTEKWNDRHHEAFEQREALAAQVIPLVRERKGDDFIPFTGQTAGLIRDVKSVAEIISEIISEAESILSSASKVARNS